MIATRARHLVALVGVILVSACAPAAPSSPSPAAIGYTAAPGAAASSATGSGSIVIVGRIVTMGEPPVAEALLIQDGTVAAIGTRDEVLALAGDQVRVDIGPNVAYPGFIDAHAH